MPPKAAVASSSKSRSVGKMSPEKMITLQEIQRTSLLSMISERNNGSGLELEASVMHVSLDAHRRILRHYARNTKPSRMSASDTLDINISSRSGETYRVSIIGIEQINRFLAENMNSSNQILAAKVVKMDPSEHVQIMYKDRGNARNVILNDYQVNIKMTRENMVTSHTQAPKITSSERILFRFKSRFSFREGPFSIDVSEVSSDTALSRVFNNTRTYEVEAEAVKNVDLNQMVAIVSKLLCLVQDSDRPIGKAESDHVIASYRQLLENGTSATQLKLRGIFSLDYRATVQDIPNKYAVTDKADGERHVLFWSKEGAYFITQNFLVKSVEITLLSDTTVILDGELIMDGVTGKKTFLAFDVIYYDQVDYLSRNKAGLRERLQVVTNAIDRSLGTSIPFQEYAVANSDMSLDVIAKYYQKELKKYWGAFAEMRDSTPGLLVIQKVYLIPYGINQSEVFRYWSLIYQMYSREKLVPYQLDGIVLTPVENPYMDNRKDALREYRWKPPQMNTLDFYLDFVTNETGQEMVYQDDQGAISYKVARLKVGRKTGNVEAPVPFVVNGVEQMAALTMEDGDPHDAEGGIIQNKIVVEFSYDSQSDLDPKFRWKPLRIRHDKTHSVRRFGTKYGNYFDVAHSIWDSIIHPVLEEHIVNLANPKNYQIQIDQFVGELEASPSNRKGSTAVTAAVRDRAYYSKTTNLGAGMRAFHNWVKSTLISTYGEKVTKALDLACGRFGDGEKFDRAGIKEYVGADLDADGLFRINGAALYRYHQMKKKGSSMTATFLQADASVPFQSDLQAKSVPNMTAANAANIDQYLNQKFDLVNVQFAIHYFMGNPIAWDNFCANLNQTMREGSYLLVTTLDGSLVHQQLENSVRFGANYVTDAGVKQNLFEIRKVYSDQDPEELGVTIDFFSPILWDDGVSKPEYLVFPQFLQDSLLEKCQLQLVETESFRQLFQMHRASFLKKGKDFPKVRDFYRSIDDPEHPSHSEALAGLQLTSLQRYYVFQKCASQADTPKRKSKAKISRPAPLISRISNQIEGDATALVTKHVRLDTITSYPDYKIAYRQILARHPKQKPIVYMLRYSKNDPKQPRISILKSPRKETKAAALIYRTVAGQYYLCYDAKQGSSGKSVPYLSTPERLLSKAALKELASETSEENDDDE